MDHKDPRANRPEDAGCLFVMTIEGDYAGRYGPFPSRSAAWTIADALGPHTGSIEVGPMSAPHRLIDTVYDDLDAEGVRIALTRLDMLPFPQRAHAET